MYLVSFGVAQTLKLGTKCFIEGTLILTSIGLVKIEDIKVEDEVWSYNEETKKEEEIICTKNHRIYIKNKGWIEANEILENDEVLLYNNAIGKVIRKELEILTYEETTYNFEVEDNHNYYVGEECVLVHNACSENDISDELFDPIENADEYVEYMYRNKKQKAFHQKSGQHKGQYISYDMSNHGHNGFSKFKLLKKVSGQKLKLIGDLDQYGNLILNKNSSNVGKLYDIFGGKKL